MASKLQKISELSDQTAHDVTQSADNWKSYLGTAARLYKFPFDEQLLIYAQRPNATACASMELWNGTMRRWVRARSKGIAVIRKNGGGRPHLEYVFDYADTRPVRGAREPYLWEMREEHHGAVMTALEQRYGANGGIDIGQRLMEAASKAVEAVYRDYLPDIENEARNSRLEGLDVQSLERHFHDLLTESVQFTLLTRCGLDPQMYMNHGELEGISEFSTPAVLHHLGNAVSSVSQDMLLEIRRTIIKHDRETRKEHQKNSDKTLANQPEISYNKDSK